MPCSWVSQKEGAGGRCPCRGSALMLRDTPFLPGHCPAPIQTTSTLYERGFEKLMKRQNKEQVPPPAVEPKKPGNKKPAKKAAPVTKPNTKQGRFRSLEEALKAVSFQWGGGGLEEAAEGPVECGESLGGRMVLG